MQNVMKTGLQKRPKNYPSFAWIVGDRWSTRDYFGVEIVKVNEWAPRLDKCALEVALYSLLLQLTQEA